MLSSLALVPSAFGAYGVLAILTDDERTSWRRAQGGSKISSAFVCAILVLEVNDEPQTLGNTVSECVAHCFLCQRGRGLTCGGDPMTLI